VATVEDVLNMGRSAAGRLMEVPGNGESVELATEPEFVAGSVFEEKSVEKFTPDGEFSSKEVPAMFVNGDVGGVKYVVPILVP